MDILKAFWRGFAGDSHSRRIRDEGRAKASRRAADPGEPVIKEPPMEIIGECLSADEFVRYVERLDFPDPLPTRIFLHHTWKPTPETWQGLSTILGMKAYYERQLWRDSQGRLHEGWTAGPHLFVAPDGIWLFSDLRYDGVGVYGHNYRSRHLEMVGDYDLVRPSGSILENSIVALGILHERLGLDIRRLNFHRDFSNKSCPGWAVTKEWIIPLVEEWIAAYRQGQHQDQTLLRQSLQRMIGDLLLPTNPQAALAKAGVGRGLLGAISHEVPMEIDDRGYIVQFFAEALLVPVHQWDKVQSLKEFEQRPARAVSRSGLDLSAPPVDPYPFEGDVR
ncbi:MAG: N-acetylmuramoyl-L-alanine amidase [Chloroflexi bacterium]|nr:N-acetylmuramoyl-L-alanine amidase [Chloroflexota bacterium]